MGERRAVLFCGAGVGGALTLVGVILVLAGAVDVPGLVSTAGGEMSEEGEHTSRAAGSLALWLGGGATLVGALLFVTCTMASRRRPARAGP